MLGHEPYYHKTLYKVTSAFGSLFNDIEIVRDVKGKEQRIKVPLSYSSADKAFSRREQDKDFDLHIHNVFPRMAFMLTGMTYDAGRKITRDFYHSLDGRKMFSDSPYTLTYELYIASSYLEDGIQIVEQILPFFAPEFTIDSELFPELELAYDLPVVLESVNYTDPGVDSDYTDIRIIEWTLTFNIKVKFAGPILDRKRIKKVDVSLFTNFDFEPEEVIHADVEPMHAEKEDEHEIVEWIDRIRRFPLGFIDSDMNTETKDGPDVGMYVGEATKIEPEEGEIFTHFRTAGEEGSTFEYSPGKMLLVPESVKIKVTGKNVEMETEE